MKKDKNALYYSRILDCLLDGQTCQVRQLADNVGLSEKTIRTKINQINDWLEQEDLGKVLKKQGTGIWLEASDAQLEKLKTILREDEYSAVSAVFEGRNRQLLGKLLRLKSGEIITMQRLADSLYLSPPTVSNILKELTPWFEKRSLKISSVRNKGISLDGDEYNYRIAIKDYLIYMMPEVMPALLGNYAAGVDIYRIRRIIVNAENAWRIELADNSFNMAWILTCLSMTRNHPEGEHKFPESQEEDIQHYVEYSFAESIYQRLEREFQVELSKSDIVLLAILLISAKRMNTILDINSENYARQYDQNLQNFVRNVIQAIDLVLDANLTNDEILFESLLIHMRSAIFRMKYSTAVSESISKYVKNEYKQPFLATWSTSYLFEEHYGIQVTEDELAGIALYIQAALIRQKKGHRLCAVLVSQAGQASSQLIIEMIKYNLPEITDIKAVSNHDFSIRQYPDADLILSTAKMETADARIVPIGERISEQMIAQIRDKVKEIKKAWKKTRFCFHNICHQLFDIELILVHPDVSDKTSLVTMMVEKMAGKGDVAEGYLESVLERERATTTSIGRGVAIPHGNMAETNEARIGVAILDKPIDWSGEPVDVVFLLAVKMTSKFEIEKTNQFYKDFLVLTENDENLETLKQMTSALEIYQYFIR
ncbi:MAG: BglG family transcription antiterminator [Lachnospiraceae bacterium]